MLVVLGLRLALAPPRLQELGDQPGPAGLMGRADPAAGVAVEVLVETYSGIIGILISFSRAVRSASS
jgi:hypothetical protein